MADTRELAPSSLVIDAENPRLTTPNTGQRDAIKAIASNQRRKLVALATDIVENGLNPADLPIVMPIKGDTRRFTVLEGNRRIAAMRILENPDILVGSVDAGVLRALRSLAAKYQSSPIDLVNCLVVKTKQEAKHWIELRHTGQNEGAGLVPWGNQEQSRFKSRSGDLAPHVQALDFLEDEGHLTPNTRAEVPATSLRRLLGTPEVRAKLGIDIEKGQLRIIGTKGETAKALAYVVNDLATGKTRVGDIYTKEQRISYAENIPKKLVVRKSSSKPKTVKRKKPSKQTHPKRTKPRDYLIPSDCILQVANPRVKEIEFELRGLSIEQYTNSVSVMMRVFIELSVDEYIKVNQVGIANDKLRTKMQAAVQDLVTQNKLTAQQARPVRQASQRNSLLAASVDTMNCYVHNQHVFPQPSDLRACWNSIQPFIQAIWS